MQNSLSFIARLARSARRGLFSLFTPTREHASSYSHGHKYLHTPLHPHPHPVKCQYVLPFPTLKKGGGGTDTYLTVITIIISGFHKFLNKIFPWL